MSSDWGALLFSGCGGDFCAQSNGLFVLLTIGPFWKGLVESLAGNLSDYSEIFLLFPRLSKKYAIVWLSDILLIGLIK